MSFVFVRWCVLIRIDDEDIFALCSALASLS